MLLCHQSRINETLGYNSKDVKSVDDPEPSVYYLFINFAFFSYAKMFINTFLAFYHPPFLNRGKNQDRWKQDQYYLVDQVATLVIEAEI